MNLYMIIPLLIFPHYLYLKTVDTKYKLINVHKT